VSKWELVPYAEDVGRGRLWFDVGVDWDTAGDPNGAPRGVFVVLVHRRASTRSEVDSPGSHAGNGCGG
jgi:hypothetical protein